MYLFFALVSAVLLNCSAFSIESFLGSHGLKSNPDIVCIMSHCLQQFTSCMENTDCRVNMECVTKCGGTNSTCLYECVNTYENDVFDDLMRCMVSDYHCLKLQSPDPTFRCSKPKQFLMNFNLSQFEGTWYVYMGLNKQYDCFDCQEQVYVPTPESKNYTLTGRYDVTTLNGSIRHRVDIQQIEQKDPQFGGLLDNTNNAMGLKMYEKWQVIDYAPDGQYAIIYYCGNMTADWWYEGSLVCSRQPVLEQKYLPNVTRTLEAMGRTVDQYCHKDNSGCKGQMIY